MPMANFFILIPSVGKKERESFCSRQNPLAVNLLRSIVVWAGTKNSLFFVLYVGISIKKFAVGVLRWSSFFE